MKLLAVAAALVAGTLLAVAAADGKRSPRLEKLALTAADNAMAKKALARLSDFAPGWKISAPTPDDGSAPPCAWMDYSQFTITGKGDADFEQAGGLVFSSTEVYANAAQALGDFKVGTRAGTAACVGAGLVKEIGNAAKLISAQTVAAPKIGDRAVDYEFVIEVGAIKYHASLFGFLHDRTIGSITGITTGRRLDGMATLARAMNARLSPGTVA